MEYTFLEQSDEKLLELADKPLDEGVALALFTTGYDPEADEAVSMSLVDFGGNELFAHIVKPQNRTGWEASPASGGLGPVDVDEEEALYEFEDEIVEALQNASIVVCEHESFLQAMLTQSWITVPDRPLFDVVEVFRASHSTSGLPGQPATAASLESVAEYYGLEFDNSSTSAKARTLIAAYRAIVAEHASVRDAKGEDYWNAYRERQNEQAEAAREADKTVQLREKRFNQMNGMLWVCGGLIFISLIIQMQQRGFDMSFMVVGAIVAVFCFAKAVQSFLRK